MTILKHNRTKGRAFAMLMSFLLVFLPLVQFVIGGSTAFARYTPPPQASPGFTGPGTWVDYTAPQSLVSPLFIAIDNDDNFYVTEPGGMMGSITGNGRVKKISDGGSTITDITYSSALNYALGIAVDHSGNVYVVDSDYDGGSVGINTDPRILKLTNGTDIWEDITHSANFNYPRGIAVDGSGNVYVTDGPHSGIGTNTDGKIYKLEQNGPPTLTGPSWEDITLSGGFYNPWDIATDSLGNVYVSDFGYGLSNSSFRIMKLSYDDPTSWTNIAGTGLTNSFLLGITVDNSDNLYGTTAIGGSVKKLPNGSNEWLDISSIGGMAYIYDIAVDSSGFLYGSNIISGNISKLMATVTYNGNGNTGGTVPVDINAYKPGVTATVYGNTGNLVKTGYTFEGWNTAANVTGTTYAPGDTFTITQSINLHAIWAPISNVTYNGNGNTGGTVPVDSTSYRSGDIATVYGNTGNLVKTGYNFAGWNTSANVTGTTYAAGNTFPVSQNVTLYAVWTALPTYTVSYQAGAGGSINGNASEVVITGGSPSSVPAVTPDDGYTFLGWSRDGGVTLLTGSQVAATIVTGAVTYTAHFLPPVTLTDITLDSTEYTLQISKTHQTVTIAVYSDGNTYSLSSGVQYTSSNPNAAEVDSQGLVTARSAGQTVISAVYQGKEAQATVSVLADRDKSPSQSSKPDTSTGVEVIVDGVKQEQLATAKEETVDGRTVTTIVVDNDKVIAKLETENNKLLTIPVSGGSKVIIGELRGHLVKALEAKDAQIQIVTDKATYTLPASQINIDSISEQIGSGVKLEDITIRIQISETSSEKTAEVQSAADRNQLTVLVHPIDFEINASYGTQTVSANSFNSYVGRMIALPEGTNPSDITTGVVLTATGELYHVPTVVVQQDGKYYALVNSLTNSTYSVISNQRELSDVSNHWSKADVNDMSSRLVIQGVTETEFRPDAAISRAEFAAIVVRGLGIQSAPYAGSFSDVNPNNWFAGTVQAAINHKLINGYEDGTFRPDQNITRQEATAVLARAMSVAKLKTDISDADVTKILSDFTDGTLVADWAKLNVAAAISNNLVNGRDGKLDLTANLTRAETAAVVRRLLQSADLINK
ncbi:MAG: xynA [Paenibacillus sp.]|jgi:uncharacterized repeat protein (TIGR02543 family)|nr:xynA [Paenibacillus sp.]